MLTDQELQSLRNLGNEAEAAADEIVRLREAIAKAASALAVGGLYEGTRSELLAALRA